MAVPAPMSDQVTVLLQMFDEACRERLNWVGDQPCPQPGGWPGWAGVACVEDGSAVAAINLRDLRLTGTLPPLSNLSSLVTLALSGNSLNGSLPAAFPQTLANLDLSSNLFTGAFPAALAAAPNVFSIDLSHNALAGTLPDRWSAPRLHSFSVGDNSLRGTIPAELLALGRLSSVYLFSNYLHGDLPPVPGLMDQISAFVVYGNELTGGVSRGYGESRSLRRLMLDTNKFSGVLPPFGNTESGVGQLAYVTLDKNDWTCPLPSNVNDTAWIDKSDTTCTGADLPLWLWLAAGFGLFVLAALLLCLLRQRRRRRRGANRRGENAAPLFTGPAVGKSPAGPSITRQSSQLTAASRPHTPCGSVVVDGYAPPDDPTVNLFSGSTSRLFFHESTFSDINEQQPDGSRTPKNTTISKYHG